MGTNGIYGECGLRRQWGDLLTTQFTVHHGLMGSLFQIRVIRAGNTIVVPVQLSESYRDVQSLLVTLLAPPLLNLAISRCTLTFSSVPSSCSCMPIGCKEVYRADGVAFLCMSTQMIDISMLVNMAVQIAAAHTFAHTKGGGLQAHSTTCFVALEEVAQCAREPCTASEAAGSQRACTEAERAYFCSCCSYGSARRGAAWPHYSSGARPPHQLLPEPPGH